MVAAQTQSHPKNHTQLLLDASQVSDAREWLKSQLQKQYHPNIQQASAHKVQQAIAQYYPNGVAGFLAQYQVTDEPETDFTIGMEQQNYHRNIHPLGYYCKTPNTIALMEMAGAYLQNFNIQQRACLWHLSSFFVIRQTLPNVTIDNRIPQAIPADIGGLVQDFDALEWAAIAMCILENTVHDFLIERT